MKKQKGSWRIERIFSHAVALQQSGRLRNTIYCIRKYIYILNQDHTILIRFVSRDAESLFKNPISFNANDYDSSDFEERNGRIYFRKEVGDFVREKRCKTPQFTPLKIHRLFKQYLLKFNKSNKVIWNESFKSCLDEDLSHIEFSGKGGKIITKQRNIYTGSVITILEKDKKRGFDIGSNKIKNFRPIGIRTNDFMALFQFVSAIIFYFSDKKVTWFESNDHSLPFKGLLSQCIYDEIGKD